MITYSRALVPMVAVVSVIAGFNWFGARGQSNAMTENLKAKEVSAYTVTQLVTRLDKQGQPTQRERIVIAQREDGSTSKTIDRYLDKDGQDPVHVKIKEVLDLEQKERWTSWPKHGARMSWPLKPKTVEYHRKRRGAVDCAEAFQQAGFAADPDSSLARILGFSVTAFRRTYGDSEEMYEERVWATPDLNCLVLRRIETKTRRAPEATFENTTETVSIEMGSPDSDFFEVAPSLKEVSPSEFVAIVESKRGSAAIPDCVRTNLDERDEKVRRYRSEGQ